MPGTVLVGQAVLGWHHDLADRDRDACVYVVAALVVLLALAHRAGLAQQS